MSNVNPQRVLQREEIAAILADLHRRSKRRVSVQTNLVIFRLSCCCGLRVQEIAGLNLNDVSVVGPRPAIRVRKEITKGQEGKRRTRLVPLWWDKGTLADLAKWKADREEHGFSTDPLSPFVCSLRRLGKRINKVTIASRWKTAITILGPERVAQLSIHTGRHSFCSHALNGGRSAVEVRDAAGHANVSTTCQYLHALDRDVADIFNFNTEIG